MLQRHHSSLLEFEAANYFDLDPDQVNMLNRTSGENQSKRIQNHPSGSLDEMAPRNTAIRPATISRQHQQTQACSSSAGSSATRVVSQQQAGRVMKPQDTMDKPSAGSVVARHHQQVSSASSRKQMAPKAVVNETTLTSPSPKSHHHRSTGVQHSSTYHRSPSTSASHHRRHYQQRQQSLSSTPPRHQRHHHYHQKPHTDDCSLRVPGNQRSTPMTPSSYLQLESSTTSTTNSLPSISSSPSVSPSLVCPHLSLDDILSLRGTSRSAHTIGLCERCRLDPPPNIQSPLSPLFRPSLASSLTGSNASCQVPYNSCDTSILESVQHHHLQLHHNHYEATAIKQQPTTPNLKRGYSDHHVNARSSGRLDIRKRQTSNLRSRDDSLDYYLEPSELRRLQMSPTMRHSVEFIRKNATEAGRILKIYKNGLPYDKPLRICICRGEFANLTNLLDYINSRQLIPLGARYLFHIDGQLVYSINELKHGSSYIVSGTRTFDLRASNTIKELQQKELQLLQQQEQAKRQAKLPSVHHSPVHNHHNSQQQQEQIQHQTSHPRLAQQTATIRQPGLPSLVTDNKSAITFKTGVQTSAVEASLRSKPGLEDTTAARRNIQHQQSKHQQQQGLPPKKSPTTRRPAMPTGDSNRQQQPQARVGQSLKRAGQEQVGRERRLARVDYAEDDYDDAGLVSKSDENLVPNQRAQATKISDSQQQQEKPARVVRAKSELSALPSKRKKNVTFVDTYRASSPTVATSVPSRLEADGLSRSEDSSLANELSTSDIGIQVSDSIEGYLIDLPLAIPASDNGTGVKRSYLQKGQGSQASRRVGKRDFGTTTTVPRTTPSGGRGQDKSTSTGRSRRQIVTISERQLSLEEMSKLKDLDHGDHHIEAHKIQHVTIQLDGSDQTAILTKGLLLNAEDETVDRVGSNLTDETSTGGGQRKTKRRDPAERRIITLITTSSKDLEHTASGGQDDATDGWQYPGGREASTTPTERPVSQSEPNDIIRATVTTPTPSISTAGDSNSLGTAVGTIGGGEEQGLSEAEFQRRDEQQRSPLNRGHSLPVKQRVAVVGKLRNGIHPPTKNFRLTWVNGFSINDQYPENSTIVLARNQPSSVGQSQPAAAGDSAAGELGDARLLSPIPSAGQRANAFKLSERFHNWICYSRRHDELIYPAGCLVILWCRWTNEQRYYSKHTSNVSAISLASLDLDLAASAQIGDPSEKIVASIHLWSLTTLETLQIVDNDHFRGRRIFSLKVRNTLSDGCEISVAANDDKRLWLYVCHLRLSKPEVGGEPRVVGAGIARSGGKSTASKKQQSGNSSTTTTKLSVIKVNKPLQPNQMPLLLTRMTNVRGLQPTTTATISATTTTAASLTRESSEDLLLSFGRRQFQVWLADKKQQKLLPLQLDNKSASFVDVIVRANCLARMSPSEFLVGDSEGNITLLTLKCKQKSLLQELKKPKLFGGSSGNGETAAKDLKCSIDARILATVTGNNPDSNPGASTSTGVGGSSSKQLAPITCLTRITGNLFASGDSNCTIRFWKIERERTRTMIPDDHPGIIRMGSEEDADRFTVTCRQLSAINLPFDLGFVCAIVLAKYDWRKSLVEFYVSSTSNAILFGSMKLQAGDSTSAATGGTTDDAKTSQANSSSSLSVVFEGHETSALNLVADFSSTAQQQSSKPENQQTQQEDDGSGGEPRPGSSIRSLLEQYDYNYFTCSVDCKICKWSGKNLVWKSLLPSACASLAVHPVGFVLATGSADGTVYILDKISGLLISYFPLTPVCINCLAYSRDGSLLAAGCANGSIFILPVYERGLKYKKVSIFQSPYPVVSLQFSVDNQFILTSVTQGPYQELILWDLPNFRYMRDNVKMAADKIEWFDSICSGSEDVRAIWENSNLVVGGNQQGGNEQQSQLQQIIPKTKQMMAKRLSTISASTFTDPTSTIVNLSCHRLINSPQEPTGEPSKDNFVIASDTHGYLRLFRYPCYDIQQGFYEARVSSSPVNCCCFLSAPKTSKSAIATSGGAMFVSSSTDGSICLWVLE